MGEVYRATDTNLKRTVAIKVLPEAVATDGERLARFQREAEVLARLNHPNIAAIYGLEKSDGTAALVMELVEGPTLADRIAQGPIPVDDALPIAKQIAEAVEAAHEQGIVHRDLKPANVKMRPDGIVKVLDFGLAKALDPVAAGSTDGTASPTITSPAMMTQMGVILGTAAYMSPEQAHGRAVDKRTDIWAFGCLFFEMVTGRRAFEGEDIPDTLAAVLRGEPEWTAVPANVSPALVALLRGCLNKDRRKRVADISTALFVIDAAGSFGTAQSALSPAIAVRTPRAARVAIYGAAALVVAAIAGGGVWFGVRPAAPRVSWLGITASPTAALTVTGIDRDLAITPDGLRVFFVGNNGRGLFTRPLEALDPVRLVAGTVRGPFVSPDGQWVGFVDTLSLKRVAITGGPPVPIATLEAAPRGATWTPHDTIVFATASLLTGLQEVPAAGGPTTVLTRPERARGEADHVWPELLPGGQAVLFTILPVTGSVEATQVAVLDRRTGTQKVLVTGGSHAHYVRSGHLVYAAANTLRAVAFDPVTLVTQGTSVPVVSDVVTAPSGGVDAVVAADGTLAYVSGAAALQRTLAWVDRQGLETPIDAPPRAYTYPRISPDGGRVVVRIADQLDDLWVLDVLRPTLTRKTFNPGFDNFPVWTLKGDRLFFSSDREDAQNIYWQGADGIDNAVERLTRSPNNQVPSAVSPDGTLIFTEVSPTTGEDVMQLELAGNRAVTPLVQSSFTDRNGVVSPNGRFLAYEANDSGPFEVYVRPYPAVNSDHHQVSTGGGTRPLWSRTGEELFYVSPKGAILRVGVGRGASWTATTPTTVVKEGYATALVGFSGRTYDLSPDGQRFLVFKSVIEATALPPQLIVVQHFDEELKRLVPTR